MRKRQQILAKQRLRIDNAAQRLDFPGRPVHRVRQLHHNGLQTLAAKFNLNNLPQLHLGRQLRRQTIIKNTVQRGRFFVNDHAGKFVFFHIKFFSSILNIK